MPYAMLQVRMQNRREYRIVAVNGKVEYEADITTMVTRGHLFPGIFLNHIMDFAQLALNAFTLRCVGAISDCILRIDVMTNNNNELVVNEFESFEAAKTTEDMIMLNYVTNSISNYWYNKLLKVLI